MRFASLVLTSASCLCAALASGCLVLGIEPLACEGNATCPPGRLCNDGVCVAPTDAPVGEGEGEPPPTSCAEVLSRDPFALSGDYVIDVGGQALSVYCDMTTAGGGWTRVFDYTEGNPCPGGWLDGARGCIRATANRATTAVSSPVAFTEVRGAVRALGLGGADGFRDTNNDVTQGAWVDGVGITVGTPPRHVFSFAVGSADDLAVATSVCPCAGGPPSPPVVANDYLCESPIDSLVGGIRVFDQNDVLFDGADITDVLCDGDPESAASFQVAHSGAVGEAFAVHLMMSQGPSDEDVALSGAELFVR